MRIAIVGAGVAGMALAILAAKRGYQVTLYERANAVSSMGAGVTLWPNAVFVLRQLGLEQQLLHSAGQPDSMCQFDSEGNALGTLYLGLLNQLSGFASLTILRSDLMRILSAALDALDVEVHFGYAITPQEIDRLQQQFDLVVGADGRMRSVVRQLLHGSKASPVYQGFINVIGISRLEEGGLGDAIHDFRGSRQRFGIVPVRDGACYWAAAWSTPIVEQPSDYDWYAEIEQRFKSWAVPIQQVLESSIPSSIKPIFVHDLEPLAYWHKDNLLIIGDAAHASLPTSGQGACQALEDAWHLVCLLDKRDRFGSLDQLLDAFYQQRISKACAAQQSGRQVAKMIFKEESCDDPMPTKLTAEQLSQFWMQGLVEG